MSADVRDEVDAEQQADQEVHRRGQAPEREDCRDHGSRPGSGRIRVVEPP